MYSWMSLNCLSHKRSIDRVELYSRCIHETKYICARALEKKIWITWFSESSLKSKLTISHSCLGPYRNHPVRQAGCLTISLTRKFSSYFYQESSSQIITLRECMQNKVLYSILTPSLFHSMSRTFYDVPEPSYAVFTANMQIFRIFG